jgi:hypothetical protein
MVAAKLHIIIDPEDPVRVNIVFVITQLIHHVEHDQEGGSKANGQAYYVNGCIEWVLSQTPERSFEIVFDHINDLATVYDEVSKKDVTGMGVFVQT